MTGELAGAQSAARILPALAPRLTLGSAHWSLADCPGHGHQGARLQLTAIRWHQNGGLLPCERHRGTVLATELPSSSFQGRLYQVPGEGVASGRI